jgi:uroporphyrin-III C-methyltransferase/precorrin-2 dehydrogenase/sirohydrochlorin ferrochelatase
MSPWTSALGRAQVTRHPSDARGHVTLVGAGPGGADLITLRGARCLAQADLVLYDALVDARLLALAPRARQICVGKRAGRPSVRQATIERLLVWAARRGQRVVRLKCGDPFVFGRGGEEALALARAGITFEIVPGVTSAVAAPALAGIPVTHRGLASAFVVLSGHDEAVFAPILDALTPQALTLVVLMGLGRRASLVQHLLARGWDADTPAAVCLAAGTEGASTWRGSLRELAGAPLEPAEAAGTIVIGAVASVGARLAHTQETATPATRTSRARVA